MEGRQLIVIAGPTASGKTAVAIQLAQLYDTVIVSADSRQFYREMSVGTAKPSVEELAAATHYFVDSNTVTEPFSVGSFEKECLALLDELFKTHSSVILVGGSGLYIKAVCEGFDALPPADAFIRDRLNKEFLEKGITFLQEKLKLADAAYYAKVDLNNPQRIIRALEVFETTGKPFSAYRTSMINKRPFQIIKFCLNMERSALYSRIDQRVDNMVDLGLIQEVRSLLPFRHLNALNTVGYSELFDHFDGKTDLETAIALIKQNTRRFAKRQITWFKKDEGMLWLEAGKAGLINEITANIGEKHMPFE